MADEKELVDSSNAQVLRTGDVLVCRPNRALSPTETYRLNKFLRSRLPAENFIIMPFDVECEIVKPSHGDGEIHPSSAGE